jgi:hypothetical protein
MLLPATACLLARLHDWLAVSMAPAACAAGCPTGMLGRQQHINTVCVALDIVLLAPLGRALLEQNRCSISWGFAFQQEAAAALTLPASASRPRARVHAAWCRPVLPWSEWVSC